MAIAIAKLDAKGRDKRGAAVIDYLLAVEEMSQGMRQAAQRYHNDNSGQVAVSYYFDGGADAVQSWSGKMAAELGLVGKPVDKEAMLKLAQGYHPYTDEPLCRNAGAKPREVPKIDRLTGKPVLDKNGNPIIFMEGGHRVGFDLVITPPKSVSIAFALGDDDERIRILQAHKRANDVAMKYLESKVETRRGAQGKDVIETQGLVIMQAVHTGSRELEMNLHTHNLCFGVAKGEDGKWGTYDSQAFYDHQTSADNIYKTELACSLRELGYGIEQIRAVNSMGEETGVVSFEISGISRELIESQSTRRKQILEYEMEHGVNRQAACLATRKHKDEPCFDELQKMWGDTLALLNEKSPGLVPTIADLKIKADINMRVDDDQKVLNKLHATEAVFKQVDLVSMIASENMGKMRLGEVLIEVENFKVRAGVAVIAPQKLAKEDRGDKLSRKYTEVGYAAQWMVEMERNIINGVKERSSEDYQKVSESLTDDKILAFEAREGFKLSAEQKKAVQHVTVNTGGVAIISGAAGTGKTTVTKLFSDIFKADGRNVMGACVADKAVAVLEAEGGFPCRSVAKTISMLERGKLTLSSKDVLVLDEAGMLDTRQTHTLLEYARKAGSKVILQGDLMQLQSIGAGSGMALARSAISDAQLTEIRRQAKPEHREMAAMFYEYDASGRMVDLRKGDRNRAATLAIGQKLLLNLHKLNAIDNYAFHEQKIDGLVGRYMSSKCPIDQRLVLASTHADVLELNGAIRRAMQSKGLVDRESVAVEVIDSKGERRQLEMSRGDRVVFTKSDARGLDVVNGDVGTIVQTAKSKGEGEGYELLIRIGSKDPMKDGRLVNVRTSDYKHLAHNYATTIHKAQGEGKEEILHLAHSGMLDNHSSLVSFTRVTKGKYTMFTDTETLERLHERLGLERLKENATPRGVVSEKYNQSIKAIEGLRNSIDGFISSGSRNKHQTKQRETISIFGLGP